MRHGSNRHPHLNLGFGLSTGEERRVSTTVMLTHLTATDGAWLARALPALQRRARPQAGAVRVEDVVLRYRPGRLSVADALDATAQLLEPFSAAGAELERRGEWYISDDEDDDDDSDDDDDERPARLEDSPEQDLLVSARVVVDAIAEDAGAATLYWAALALQS